MAGVVDRPRLARVRRRIAGRRGGPVVLEELPDAPLVVVPICGRARYEVKDVEDVKDVKDVKDASDVRGK